MGQCKKCGVRIPDDETCCQKCTRQKKTIIQILGGVVPVVLGALVTLATKGKMKLK